jgi:hypothetical protein
MKTKKERLVKNADSKNLLFFRRLKIVKIKNNGFNNRLGFETGFE